MNIDMYGYVINMYTFTMYQSVYVSIHLSIYSSVYLDISLSNIHTHVYVIYLETHTHRTHTHIISLTVTVWLHKAGRICNGRLGWAAQGLLIKALAINKAECTRRAKKLGSYSKLHWLFG